MTFRVRDLLINVTTQAGAGGSAGMPNPDCEGSSVAGPLTPHTPVLQVANLTPQFQAARRAVRRAFGEKDPDGQTAMQVARAYVGDPDGSPALSAVLANTHRAVAGGIVQAAVGFGSGGTALPGPDDETPPSPISPIAHEANLVLRAEHLATIRSVLTEAIAAIDKAGETLRPQTAADARTLASQLEIAAKELQTMTAKAGG